MHTTTDQGARDKVVELVTGIRVAMMATRGASGTLHARPMATAEAPFDGDLWFFTDVNSPKVEEIARDPQVLLAYSDERRQHYVSISGRAEVVRDTAKARELWSEGVRVRFPKGADDPALALVRVAVDVAEYWDSPSGTMLMAYGYVKAVATGKRPEAGENKTVRF
ncbi:pyridoxamine 5'-phosphate oxidase family protein [Alsobacter sp. R-9]